MNHHTKEKGDKGVGFVIADLMSKDISVCLPISEHLPFDLIAVYPDGKLKKVSVKYRMAARGRIEVLLKSTYSDSKKIHIKPIDKSAIDMIAIYCPDTNMVYYVDHNQFNKSICLRLEPPKNKMLTGIKLAENYLHP